jgi:hypothetical protein
VGLADLLELRLDLLNSLVFKVFYLLQCALDNTEGLRVDLGSSQ